MNKPIDGLLQSELLLRKGDKSLRELAKEIGVTAPYIHDILFGRRNAGKKVLKYLGLKRIDRPKRITYEKLPESLSRGKLKADRV